MKPYTLPYSIVQRPDDLWTVQDATGREVDGIAHEDRRNAENFVRGMAAWASSPGGQPYIHMMPASHEVAADEQTSATETSDATVTRNPDGFWMGKRRTVGE